jgi:hypothetical protein
MMYITDVVGRRMNEWEVGGGSWFEPNAKGHIKDPNLYDDKARMLAYLSYDLLNNNLDEFQKDDFVANHINNALLINLQIDKKIYYLRAPNGGLYPYVVMTSPSRAKKLSPASQAEDYNGLLRSIEWAYNLGNGTLSAGGDPEFEGYGSGIQEHWDETMGADAIKHTVVAASAYPNQYHVPQVSRRHIYGPWATTVQGFGKVDIESDPSLVPENFGSILTMNQVALLQCWAGGTPWMEQESGDLTFVGGPEINMGEQLPSGGPFCTGVRVEVGVDRILTTYNFETWDLRYGKLANFYKERIKTLVDLRNQFTRELSISIQRQDQRIVAAKLNNLFNLRPPRKFKSGSTHGIMFQVADGDINMAGSMSHHEYIAHAKKHRQRAAYCSPEALFRGFGADGGNSYYPETQAGNAIGGIYPAAQNLNHFNLINPYAQGVLGTDGHDVSIVKGNDGAFGTYSLSHPDVGYPSKPFPLGLRAPLILVGWGYNTCGQPIPGDGMGHFLHNHRQLQGSWKAGPLSVNWHEKTKTWVPQPIIYKGIAQATTCGDGDVDVKLNHDTCAEDQIKAKNPLNIPVGPNKEVIVMLDIFNGEWNIVNTGVTKQIDYVVCDLTCCDDGSLKISKRDFYLHEDPEECARCPIPDCDEDGDGDPTTPTSALPAACVLVDGCSDSLPCCFNITCNTTTGVCVQL